MINAWSMLIKISDKCHATFILQHLPNNVSSEKKPILYISTSHHPNFRLWKIVLDFCYDSESFFLWLIPCFESSFQTWFSHFEYLGATLDEYDCIQTQGWFVWPTRSPMRKRVTSAHCTAEGCRTLYWVFHAKSNEHFHSRFCKFLSAQQQHG